MTLAAYGQICVVEKPSSATFTFRVIERMSFLVASFRICLPVSVASTPLMDAKRFLKPVPRPGNLWYAFRTPLATDAVFVPWSPWTITSNVAEGFAWAAE